MIYLQYKKFASEVKEVVDTVIGVWMIEYIKLKKNGQETYFKIGFKDTSPDLLFYINDKDRLNLIKILEERVNKSNRKFAVWEEVLSKIDPVSKEEIDGRIIGNTIHING